jgi:protein-disulfide isomerase/uncharacterized membrane protein
MARALRWSWLSLALLFVGLATSGYLLYRSFALIVGTDPKSADICSAFFGTGCDQALADQSSWVWGIPLAGWAIVFYVTLTSLVILALVLRDEFGPQALLTGLLLSTAGLANSLVLAGGMLAGWMLFCPLCLVLHALNLLLVPVLAIASGLSLRAMVAALGAGAGYVLGRRSQHPARDAWRVVGFFCVALLAVVSYQWVYIQTSLRQAANRAALAPDDIIEEFLEEPVKTIPIADSDPQRGNPRAAAVLVVFSDFQCPHCGRLAQTIDDLHERYGDDLRIVFKHFPLSTDCNSLMKKNMHPRSCELAWAAEAAHRQGKFWAFHDAAFAEKSPTYSDQDIQRLATGAAVDLRQFDTDRDLPAIKEKVSHDVKTGTDLKVRGTPTLFLNGRVVPDLTLGSLEILVEHEVHPR